FHRFALELVQDARVDLFFDALGQLQCMRKRSRVRRVILQGCDCALADLCRGIEMKEMCATVYRVHRLASLRLPRIAAREDAIFLLQIGNDRKKYCVGERGLHRMVLTHSGCTRTSSSPVATSLDWMSMRS